MDKLINTVNVQKEDYGISDKYSVRKIKYKDNLLSPNSNQVIDLTNLIFGISHIIVNGESFYPNEDGEVDIGTFATLSDIELVNETINSVNTQLLQKIVEEQNARIQSDKKINVSQSSTEGYITFTNSDGDSIDIWVGSSGSGGGTDYNNLANKPKINGVNLIGNKNGNDLQLANLSDLENKQDKLESGINIKTINNQSLLEFGNLELQNKLESGVTIKTINNQSILGSGNIDIQGGGSGGTSNYNELSNKPKINNTELVGNKSSSDLKLQDKLESGINIKTINNQSILGSGNINIQGGGGSGTSDYKELDNKPKINNTELVGNKSSSDLNLENRAIELTKEEYLRLESLGQLKQDVDYYVTDDFTQGYPYVKTVNGNGIDNNANVTLKISDLENDIGYITEQSLSQKVDKKYVDDTFATNENLAQEIVNRQNNDNGLREEINSLNQLLTTIQSRINELNALIPSQTSSTNQLADKNFVNSSISTNTSNFIGTFNSLEELESQTATNNDYAFWKTTDSNGNVIYKRYKYVSDDNTWQFEYDLNNSSFTAEQWNTINSGITSDSIPTKVSELENDSNFINDTQLNGALVECQKFKMAPNPNGELKYVRIKYKIDDEPTLLISFKGYTSLLLNLSYYVILLKEAGNYVYGFKSGYNYNNYIYICYTGWRVPKVLNIAGDECEIETITKDEYDVAETNGQRIKLM